MAMKKYNCGFKELLKLFEDSLSELETIEFSDESLKILSAEKD